MLESCLIPACIWHTVYNMVMTKLPILQKETQCCFALSPWYKSYAAISDFFIESYRISISCNNFLPKYRRLYAFSYIIVTNLFVLFFTAVPADQMEEDYSSSRRLRCLRVSPDGRHLVSGDRAGNIRFVIMVLRNAIIVSYYEIST